MLRVCVTFLLLAAVLHCAVSDSSVDTLDPEYNQDNRERRYPDPTTHGNYTCMEDWGITCTVDSQCCSGTCMAPFCNIIGIEKEKKMRRKKQKKPRKNRTPAPDQI